MAAETQNTSASSTANSGQGGSPANAVGVAEAVKQEVRASKRRRPMSVPTRRLEATAIPGHHLHWIKAENVPRALDAAYVFVTPAEVEINTRNVSVPSEMGGTADLGDRVSVQYGGDTLYLMKLKEEFYREDMAALSERNQLVWGQIFRNEQIAGQTAKNPGDPTHAYVKEEETKVEGADLARAARRSNQPLFQRQFR